MKRYEVVREIENNCKRNQMRDVLFFEVETDDPVEWVRQEVKGKEVEISTETNSQGELTVFVESAGLPRSSSSRSCESLRSLAQNGKNAPALSLYLNPGGGIMINYV